MRLDARMTAPIERPGLSPLHQPPAWADDYTGLPWKNGGRDRAGLDCWGLVRLVAAERFGATLPAYDETVWREEKRRRDQCESNAELGAFIRGERLKNWTTAWEAASAAAGEPLGGPEGARAGDVILIRNLGAGIHMGIVVAPGHMLHIEEGIEAVCVPYDVAGTARRVIGFYRWEGKRC